MLEKCMYQSTEHVTHKSRQLSPTNNTKNHSILPGEGGSESSGFPPGLGSMGGGCLGSGGGGTSDFSTFRRISSVCRACLNTSWALKAVKN